MKKRRAGKCKRIAAFLAMCTMLATTVPVYGATEVVRTPENGESLNESEGEKKTTETIGEEGAPNLDESISEVDVSTDTEAIPESVASKVGDKVTPLDKVKYPETKKTGTLEKENWCMLTVSTGSEPGTDKIMYFAVCYEDVDGNKAKAYVVPDKENLAKSMKIATEMGGKSQIDECESDMKAFGVSSDTSTATGDALAKNSCDRYLFRTLTNVKSVYDIEIMTYGRKAVNGKENSDTSKKLNWTCQGISVTKIDDIYGVFMAGNLSDTLYMDYKGTRIASTDLGVGRKDLKSSATAGKTYAWSDEKLITMKHEKALISESKQIDSKLKTDGYMFRFDMEDDPEAIMENCVNDDGKKLSDMKFTEQMTMEINYRDDMNCPHKMQMPVMASTYRFLKRCVGQKAMDAKVEGLGQQGNIFGYYAVIPDFASLKTLKLYSGSQMGKDSSLKVSGSKKDDFDLSAFGMYKPKDITTELTVGTLGSRLEYDFGNMELKYLRNAYGDKSIALSGDSEVTVKTAVAKADVKINKPDPASPKNLYLVAITTDKPKSSGTTGEGTIKLNFTTPDGLNGSTDEIDLKKAVSEYYGRWPGKPSEDFAYKMGVTPGNTVLFTTQIGNVENFSGANVRTNSSDDWQLAAVRILKLSDFGPREGVVERVASEGYNSEFTYFHPYKGMLVSSFDERVLVSATSGDTGVNLDFINKDQIDTMENDNGMVGYENSMTWQDTQRNFGFTKARRDYEVAVTVDSGLTDAEGNDDAGSKNNFYFQLCFDSGNSAIVLANQQLSADGFRTGQTEQFTISLNQDYGDLNTVRIIPDMSTDSDDTYDKLSIESIKVTEKSGGASNRVWRVSSVGQIGIDFREEAEYTSMKGAKGRTLEEAARSFTITTRGNSQNLLFAIATVEPTNNIQFEGTVQGILHYEDQNHVPRERKIDIVQAIQEYNKGAYASEDIAPTAENAKSTGEEELTVSNPNRMFRPGHIDRFMVSLDDVSKIERLELSLGGETNGTWCLSSCTVSLVTKTGRQVLNDNDEYVRATESTYLTSGKKTGSPAYSFRVIKNANGSKTTATWNIEFKENEIDLKDSNSLTTYSKTPVSQNDEVSIYIFPKQGDAAADFNTYTITTALRYQTIDGNSVKQIKANKTNMRRATKIDAANPEGVRMFIASRLSASQFASMVDLTIKVDDKQNNLARINSAIVQHTRSGVVLETYKFDFNGDNITQGKVTRKPLSGTDSSFDKQTVAFMLTKDTEQTLLEPENKDIIVRFKYKSALDPMERVLYSPNYRLTDLGILSATAGQVVTFETDIPYIEEVLEVSAAQMGGVKGGIKCAYVDCRQVTQTSTSDGEKQVTKSKLLTHYSFAKKIKLEENMNIMEGTSNVLSSKGCVKPLSITVVTGKTSDGTAQTGFDGPVRMNIHYKDYDGQEQSYTMQDARNYILAENEESESEDVDNSGVSFAAGTTRKLLMLLPEARELTYIDIEPYNTDGTQTGTWTPESMSVTLGEGDAAVSVSRTFTDPIIGGTSKRVYFMDLALSALVQVVGTDDDVKDARNVAAGSSESVLISPDDKVRITPTYKGATGCTYSVYKVDTTGATTPANDLITGKKNLLFTPPAGDSDTNQTYQIVFTSVDDPSLTFTLGVTVSANVSSTDDSESSNSSDTTE